MLDEDLMSYAQRDVAKFQRLNQRLHVSNALLYHHNLAFLPCALRAEINYWIFDILSQIQPSLKVLPCSKAINRTLAYGSAFWVRRYSAQGNNFIFPSLLGSKCSGGLCSAPCFST